VNPRCRVGGYLNGIVDALQVDVRLPEADGAVHRRRRLDDAVQTAPVVGRRVGAGGRAAVQRHHDVQDDQQRLQTTVDGVRVQSGRWRTLDGKLAP